MNFPCWAHATSCSARHSSSVNSTAAIREVDETAGQRLAEHACELSEFRDYAFGIGERPLAAHALPREFPTGDVTSFVASQPAAEGGQQEHLGVWPLGDARCGHLRAHVISRFSHGTASPRRTKIVRRGVFSIYLGVWSTDDCQFGIPKSWRISKRFQWTESLVACTYTRIRIIPFEKSTYSIIYRCSSSSLALPDAVAIHVTRNC